MRCLTLRARGAVLAVLTLLGPTLVGNACATTIRVARDGSGDYVVLADAVDAAVSGDTITIAPGVYPEVRPYTAPGGQLLASARVVVAELTIIGDDTQSVIVGPEAPATDLERGPIGISCSSTGNVRVSGITVRNVSAGVWGNDEWTIVEDCFFEGNFNGVNTCVSGSTVVRGCEFREHEDAGVMVFNICGATGATVETCTFIDNAIGVDLQPKNCILRDSTFVGGIVGAQVSFGGSCRIERCTFEGNAHVGLAIINGAQVYLYDCEFIPPTGLNILLSGLLVGTGNSLNGGSYATIEFFYASETNFHGNHILNGGGPSVQVAGGHLPVKVQDFSNNYWGTTDRQQIDAWIVDYNDEPGGNFVIVDYEPLAEFPIGTEATSFGQLKTRFSSDH